MPRCAWLLGAPVFQPLPSVGGSTPFPSNSRQRSLYSHRNGTGCASVAFVVADLYSGAGGFGTGMAAANGTLGPEFGDAAPRLAIRWAVEMNPARGLKNHSRLYPPSSEHTSL